MPVTPAALRDVPYMGVIYVVAEAMKLGFRNGHPDWSNLGQGQPEVGEMAGAPERIQSVDLLPEDAAYGPLEGIDELREVVAAHYNRLYRQGKSSQYTAANVSVASGGRLALTRAAAALGSINVGHQVPDYTAYEDMFDYHLSRLNPVTLWGRAEDGFAVTAEDLATAIREHELGAFIFSNPCNPTGTVVQGDELQRYVSLARSTGMALLADEFYSHFIYEQASDGSFSAGSGPISSAAFVEDVEQDPVLIFDGLTKNYRYPGWRIGWVVGPADMVETTARTASAIDGGPSRLAQRAALEVLEPARADQETNALREVFCAKRNVMIERLTALGVRFPRPSHSTFYCWGSLEDLPAPFNDGMEFFRRALEHRVLTVPGEFFDVNPGKRRQGESPYRQWMRFSFGPPMENMLGGLTRLEEMLRSPS
jgi:aspartate/methionine/tyrosine aminotransferase